MMNHSSQTSIRKYIIDTKNYKVIRKINSGGFSSIYEVQKKHSGKFYAAKVINLQINKEESKKMISREIEIMVRCQHPTIVNFIGYSYKDFFDQKNVTILMELAEQGSLSDAIEKVQKGLADVNFDNTTRQIILVGIARGMMYLHQNQILHRDLKPSNILLDKFLHPHITDFGLSKFTENDSSFSKNKQCGTPTYMAPEVMEEKRYNGKADVYSFGILMFEVVTDSFAFPLFHNGKISTLQFYNKVVYDNYRPKFNGPVKKSLKKLIERCWSKDPNERPTFEEIFKKLAFNVEDSIYDILEGQDNDGEENKYYLDDIDIDALLSYIDDINYTSKPSFNITSNLFNYEKIIEPLKRENEELKEQLYDFRIENEEMKNIISNIQKENQNLTTKIDLVSKENEEMKERLSKLEKQFELFNTSKNIENDKNKDLAVKKSKSSIISSKDNADSDDSDDEEKVTIDDFNSMSLKSQNHSILKIISNSKSRKYSYLEKIQQLLQFFMKYKSALSKSCVKIERKDTNEIIKRIDTENKVLIHHDGIEILYINNKFNNREFINILKSINDITISIRYPSNIYKEIYSNLINIKKQTVHNMKIGIFITGIKKISNEFKDNKNISFIKIDSTVTEIKDEKSGSFRKCTSLTKVEIPSSVNRIGSRSFFNCTSLTQINIPNSISVINYATFHSCSSLIQINIPSSVKIIEPMAFCQCVSLRQIEIPSSVTEIGYQAFDQCSSLTNIKIPSSITIIHDWTFRLCTSLIHVEIPTSITEIGREAFNECSSLLKIKIPSSVKKIGEHAFMPQIIYI